MKSFIDSDDFQPHKKRPKQSSSSNSNTPENIQKIDGVAVIHIAVEFKRKQQGDQTAGISIYFGKGNLRNHSTTLRGKSGDLKPAIAQLTGKIRVA